MAELRPWESANHVFRLGGAVLRERLHQVVGGLDTIIHDVRPEALVPTRSRLGLRSRRMEPTPSRPHLPRGYGIEKATGAPGEHLPWSQVSEWLTSARNYWVCSTRPDGRPHVKPVWGIWLEGQLLFSTHPETITARNLRANPALAVHLESGDQVVIVEGGATKLDDRSLLARFGEAYEAKYDWPLSPEDLDPGNPDAAFYAVRPRVALSWDTAAEIGETITRWNFDRSTEFNRTFGRQC